MHSVGVMIQLLGMLYSSQSQEEDPSFSSSPYTSSGAPSVCSTLQYRTLAPSLQNEHQCNLLERLNEEFGTSKTQHDTLLNDVITKLEELSNKVDQQTRRQIESIEVEKYQKMAPSFPNIPLVRDCNELKMNGFYASGVYPIRFSNGKILNIWCDMETDRGGWTVIQRRQDGSVNFTRNWDAYAFGFGNPNSEYWLGNEYIHWMTRANNYSLRIDLWDWEGDEAYATYDHFALSNEADGYRLIVSGYSGTSGDSFLSYHQNMKFSTHDKDNDMWFSSCARKDESGWWYRDCGYSTLNGRYVQGGTIPITQDGLVKGIIWYHWKRRYSYSLKRVEMKIKPSLAIKVEIEQLAALEAIPPTNPSSTTNLSDSN